MPQNNNEIDWKEFIEKGAELEHIRWAKWQNYLHTFLVWNNDIKMWTLPHEKKEWWDSEIRTPYSMLTEKQKESDRKETREYLPLIEKVLTSHEQKVKETILQKVKNLRQQKPSGEIMDCDYNDGLEEKFNNPNFQRFAIHGKEIDNNIASIQRRLGQFGNNPHGSEKVIVYITRKVLDLLDLLDLSPSIKRVENEI